MNASTAPVCAGNASSVAQVFLPSRQVSEIEGETKTPPTSCQGRSLMFAGDVCCPWLRENSTDFELQKELPLLSVSLIYSLLGTKLLLWIEIGQSDRNPW